MAVDETSLPLSLSLVSTPPVVMLRYTRLLRETVWLQLQGGNLFREGERLVHRCGATYSAANKIENAGDEFVTRGRGRDIVLNQLLMLPGMSKLDAEAQAGVCRELCTYFCGNVGFGPYAAEALGLRELFSFTPGLILNREILAGLFEEVVGVLQRSGCKLLVRQILMWCVGCVLHLINCPSLGAGGQASRSTNFYRELDVNAYMYVTVELNAHDILWPLKDATLRLKQGFAVADPDRVFSSWVQLALQESSSGQCLQSTLSLEPAGSKSRHMHLRGGDMRSTMDRGGGTHYYMDLKCYDHGFTCTMATSEEQTALHATQEAVYAEATDKGWRKPGRGWGRARCPKCAEAWHWDAESD